ncbi:MAG: glycosyltransferase [Solirubrobacteraceae bacterium]|nr:glycosyltransferase [Solirubrobacteraceae bacterium]
MRLTLISAGSRGDIAPFAVLARALAAAGHETTLLAHEEFRPLLGDADVRFMAAQGPNPRDLLDSPEGRRLLAKSKSPSGYAREFRKIVEPVIGGAHEDSLAASEGADLVVYAPIAFAAFSAAERIGIPSVQLQLQPAVPSSRYPTVFSTARTLGAPGNRASHAMGERVLSMVMREPMNRAREEVLGLPPRTEANLLAAQRPLEPPPLLAFDAALVPRAPGWPELATQCGALLTHAPARATLPDEVEAFLAEPGQTAYFGLGSMVVDDPQLVVDAIAEATQRAGLRAIVQRGWGGLEPSTPSPHLLFIDELDHDLLFPRVDAIVHHGGAGTTARAARSGRPSLVLPLMGDQFFWGHRTTARGLGPRALRLDDLTADRLWRRLVQLLSDTRYADRAQTLAGRITAADRDALPKAIRHLEVAATFPLPTDVRGG